MKTFGESLRENAIKITNFKQKKMKSLAKDQQKLYENAKICYICKEKFENKYLKDKKYRKIRDHIIIQGNMEVLRIAYVIQNIVYLKKSYSFS